MGRRDCSAEYKVGRWFGGNYEVKMVNIEGRLEEARRVGVPDGS